MATHLPHIIVGLFNGLLREAIREQKSIEFTLPQLFETFSQLNKQIAELNQTETGYKEFRKVVFNIPINEEMKKRGGEIIILDNKGKVDESVYCLTVKDFIQP